MEGRKYYPDNYQHNAYKRQNKPSAFGEILIRLFRIVIHLDIAADLDFSAFRVTFISFSAVNLSVYYIFKLGIIIIVVEAIVIGFLILTHTDYSSDGSAVDRVCKGSRVPQNGGKSASRIVLAIYSFADEHGKTEDILNEIGCFASFSAEQIKDEIMRWLYDGEEPIKAHKESSTALHPHDKFGQRFSAIIDLAEFSNVRFGKLLSIDPSYISRFRNGLRTPVSNSKLTEKMCRVLYSRLKDQKRLSNLARLMKISHENLHNDTYWEKELYSWLFLSEDNTVSSFVVGMVDQIGSFSADIIKPPLSFETATEKTALSDNQPLYHGMTGLQTAVLRFLGNVIERKEKDLYLYSDQNIDWITTDKSFQQKWMSLMIQCVTSGVKIHIIHNIERNLVEIGEAIRSWLPLYPSGQIESFYLDGQKNTIFSTTLFLCPGYACIYGNNVVGTENESGNYLFETEPEKINMCHQFFDTLLGNRRPAYGAFNVYAPCLRVF